MSLTAANVAITISFLAFASPEKLSISSAQHIACTARTCRCWRTSEGVEAFCTGGNLTDIIQQLPSDTTRLEYNTTIDSSAWPAYFLNPSMLSEQVTFQRLSRLRHLTLATLPLGSYVVGMSYIKNSEMFQGLRLLQHLEIHLAVCEFNADVLKPLQNLTTLDLSYTRYMTKATLASILSTVKEIPVRILRLRNFQYPSLASADEFVDLRNDILRHLQGSRLEELDVSQNGLIIFSPGFTQFVPSLKRLICQDNLLSLGLPYEFQICSFVDIMFHTELEVLEFGYDAFPGKRSRSKRAATELAPQVDHTPIGRPSLVDHHSLHRCSGFHLMCEKFTNISCDNDELPPMDQSCSAGAGVPLKKLKVLVYSHASITSYGNIMEILNDQTICFDPTNQLEYLDASFNHYKFGLGIIKGVNQLWYMNLQYNDFVFTNFASFQHLGRLKYLLLGGNRMEMENATDRVRLNGVSELLVLDLEGTGLDILNENEFEHVPNLEILNLSRNSLRQFEVNISGLWKLSLLNISGNLISVLPPVVRDHLDTLASSSNITVDLSGNSFLSCHCQNLDFVRWMKKSPVTFAARDATLCTHPNVGVVQPWGVNLGDLSAFCFPSYTEIILTAVFSSVSATALIFVIFMCYRKRWTVRFYLHALKSAWSRDENRNKKLTFKKYTYSAFVVYSSEDRRWVHDVLMKKLEEEHNMRLCIHYRDFKPGYFIEDTIVESIDRSRKTILILSPDFLKSDWCYFEYKMARQVLVTERRDVIVLVILKSLPGKYLSRSLSKMLQKKTYLEWTTDPDGQKLFWDQMIRTLSGDMESKDPDDAV